MSTPTPVALRALVAVRVVNALGAFTLPFIALYVGESHVSMTLLIFGAATLLSRWAGAWLLDHLPVRGVILLGLTSSTAALLWLVAADTTTARLVAVAGVGLAFEIYEPATTEWIARMTEGAARSAAYTTLGAALAIAGGAAGLLAALLLPYGVAALISADAVTCAVAALVTAVLLTDPPRTSSAPAAVAAGPDDVPRRFRPSRVLLRLTVSHLGFATGYLGVLALLPLLLLGKGAPDWVPGAVLGAMSVLALASRWLVPGWPHRRVLVAGMALLAVSTLLVVGLPWQWALVPVLVYAVVDVALLGRWSAVVADAAPESERPRWFAFHGSAWAFAGVALAGLTALGGLLTGDPAAGGMLLAGLAFALGAVPLFGRRVVLGAPS